MGESTHKHIHKRIHTHAILVGTGVSNLLIPRHVGIGRHIWVLVGIGRHSGGTFAVVTSDSQGFPVSALQINVTPLLREQESERAKKPVMESQKRACASRRARERRTAGERAHAYTGECVQEKEGGQE